ncbi:hypothetical protein A9Q74_05690 [Colwellia sp. 39_35_sub15_T18]|nr:hypothetical protein A9Q74_05690 [Colwellia sp. 39_35_sub15_T18]
MKTLYIKYEYSVYFAELSVTEEVDGPKAQEIKDICVSEGGVDFTISFVEREPDKKYYRQCPMDIIVVSKHVNIPRKIPDILSKISQGLKPKEGEKAETHEELTRKEGYEYGIESYPNSLESFLLPIAKSHSALIKRIKTVLSWRCFDTRNLNVKNTLFGLLFSFDNKTWHRSPTLGSFSLASTRPEH